jgi:hypothetical protein
VTLPHPQRLLVGGGSSRSDPAERTVGMARFEADS